jgi:hypothetical protein
LFADAFVLALLRIALQELGVEMLLTSSHIIQRFACNRFVTINAWQLLSILGKREDCAVWKV